ncbi:hypothetical protein HYPDE_33308 [Hyphomicrobium denitrificans 1NES1]|uniref:Uncharacterized protein n=1 Tax=Hyphomicrobium denitrificans 1NES1 TaxID=670307 RepID=N0B480_9HYPH|nr:hypothetical protein HYPDE_33308 [Hyphomicrobium denitrificans 1NES1]
MISVGDGIARPFLHQKVDRTRTLGCRLTGTSRDPLISISLRHEAVVNRGVCSTQKVFFVFPALHDLYLRWVETSSERKGFCRRS